MKVTVGKKTISNDGRLLTAFFRNLDSSDKTVKKLEWRLKDSQCHFDCGCGDLSIEKEAINKLMPWLLNPNIENGIGFRLALTHRLDKLNKNAQD